jgi:hypothetical protein
MKFGKEVWLILFREYKSPKLFAVYSTQCTMSSPDMLFFIQCRRQTAVLYTERHDGHLAHTLLRMLFTDQKKRVPPV